ncbi:alanine/glycine:cation symporter family protein [Piscicoccus intestinalis]|uniref:alanine/glycine:cation symporter family protein n=1 Tax=Piscicoccus intestinalis TaxID=746033 RepID=UPI00278C3C1D|nr:alanine/glycine:cation symporter family protein [Piscicoccus intestinalis]
MAGVAVAVTLGGPGATFWMILAGLLGMATKFAECTLGVRYRRIGPDGTVHGGAFHYLPVAFERFGSVISKALTGLFAIAILFFGGAGGNMFQSNQTYQIVRDASGGDDSILASDGGALIFGLLLALGVGLVIIGGVKSIGRVTSKLVPAMAIIYVLSCLAVILINIGHVPDALGQILTGAFTPEGVTGGMIGVIIQGFRRAAFSNEAGLGSAPIAHSAVKTRRPVSEGFVALWEPFIDTVVICTMTALTIVIAQPQAWIDARQSPDAPAGVTITAAAFDTFLPRWDIVLALCVFLFAFSTVITWAYYSQQAWRYLFGRTRVGDLVFKIIYLFFTTIGAVLTLGAVLDFADSFLFVCAFVNLLGVGLLLPVIKQEMRDYLRDRKAGTLLQLGDESVETVNEGRAE